MAQRRAVPMAVFSPQSWHLAKLFEVMAPQLGPFKDQYTEMVARHRYDAQLEAYAKHYIEDLVRDVWRDPTNKTLHVLQFYIDRYLHDVGVIGIKNQLVQLLRNIDVRRRRLRQLDIEQDAADVYRNRDEITNYLRDIARMLHEFVTQMQTERLHEQPGAVYDMQITQLGMQAEQRGEDRFEFENALREIFPYEEFFALTQENRDFNGDRLVWSFDVNLNQLDVRWVQNDLIEAMEVSEDD